MGWQLVESAIEDLTVLRDMLKDEAERRIAPEVREQLGIVVKPDVQPYPTKQAVAIDKDEIEAMRLKLCRLAKFAALKTGHGIPETIREVALDLETWGRA